MRKPRLRKNKLLAQGHKTIKWKVKTQIQVLLTMLSWLKIKELRENVGKSKNRIWKDPQHMSQRVPMSLSDGNGKRWANFPKLFLWSFWFWLYCLHCQVVGLIKIRGRQKSHLTQKLVFHILWVRQSWDNKICFQDSKEFPWKTKRCLVRCTFSYCPLKTSSSQQSGVPIGHHRWYMVI